MSTPDHYTSAEKAKNEARAALSPRPSQITQTTPIWDFFVRLMKITLPLAALVLGVLTVAWPLLNTAEVAFNLSRDEVAVSDGKVRMMGMRYVGSDDKGRQFRIEADSGLQDNPGTPRIRLDGICAEIQLEPDILATASARSGVYRMNEGKLTLIGGVELVAENGYSLRMAGAEVDLKNQIATGQGSISGRSPLGTLEAGGMEVQVGEQIGSFSNGIHIVITPRRTELTGQASQDETKQTSTTNTRANNAIENLIPSQQSSKPAAPRRGESQ